MPSVVCEQTAVVRGADCLHSSADVEVDFVAYFVLPKNEYSSFELSCAF